MILSGNHHDVKDRNSSCIQLLRIPVAVPGSLKITKPQDEAPERDATNLDMALPRLRLLEAPSAIYFAHTLIPIPILKEFSSTRPATSHMEMV